MTLNYTQRETVTIRGKANEPLMDVDAEVVGRVDFDEGRWYHNGLTEVRMKMWDGSYRRIPEDASMVIYDAFCKVWSAYDLAVKEDAA